MTKIHLKQDKFRKVRGGYSRVLELKCDKCRGFICYYQKDGPGMLKRLYYDRILKPEIKWGEGEKLICKNCHRWLGLAAILYKAVGTKSLYPNEPRKCFILFQNAIKKKVIKL